MADEDIDHDDGDDEDNGIGEDEDDEVGKSDNDDIDGGGVDGGVVIDKKFRDSVDVDGDIESNISFLHDKVSESWKACEVEAVQL